MYSDHRSILVVHAHPDDTEAFCGGTLKLLQEKGFKITVATTTAGGMGGVTTNEVETIAIRKKEATSAAEVIDADYYCLNGRDGYLYDTAELRVAVADLIRKTRASIVLTHLPWDYHSDHRATCEITESASLLATLPNVPSLEPPLEFTPLLYHTAPLGFSTPLGEKPVPPHFAIDITSVISTKMEMLSCHKSQVELMKLMHRMDNFFDKVEEFDRNLGKLAHCQYAEVFWQHLGGGFQKEPFLQNELGDYLRPIDREVL